ncbi:PBP1A family penicillin-binding protein [bacterium]|nr:PBP1A family penicillin-binding protein [candidate division CSSED10-310 bacterium]
MIRRGMEYYFLVQRRSVPRFFIVFAAAGIILGAAGGGILGLWMRNLPPVESLEFFRPNVVTRIFDCRNGLTAELYTERRIALSREEIPDAMVKAVVAAEDADFFSHTGLDFPGIIRAAVVDLRSMKITQGASTITQQLARMLFLNNERTFSRKIKETILSVRIEQRYSKDEILTLYMNQSCFGHGAYGVESAARTFFDKPVADLTIPECALIAGVLPNPTYYSPLRNPENALRARNKVLQRMHRSNFISERELAEYVLMPVETSNNVEYSQTAPYFVEETRKLLVELLGAHRVLNGGLKVYTTLDPMHQEAADRAVHDGLTAYRSRHGDSENIQGAFISIRVGTGEITSMVGGDDFTRTKFNRAVQARRQSGSAIKPFVYLTALQEGFSPNDVVMDAPVVFEDPQTRCKYRPRNFDRKFHGPTTLRVALEKSYNVVTAKILDQIGIPPVLETVRRAGISSELPPYLSMGLGSGEVTLVELVNAYATIASNGLRSEPHLIREIHDNEDRVLLSVNPVVEETLDPRLCYQITRMLQGAVTDGSSWRAGRLNHPIAAKTGTSSDSADAWFIGFSPSVAAGAWLGFDLRRSLGQYETGSSVSGPVFTQFMEQILAGSDPEDFNQPEGIETARICRESGFLAGDNCSDTVEEVFITGGKPQRRCPVH